MGLAVVGVTVLGDTEGNKLGVKEGTIDGATEGAAEGALDGSIDGHSEGRFDTVGWELIVGQYVGAVGVPVDMTVG